MTLNSEIDLGDKRNPLAGSPSSKPGGVGIPVSGK